MQSLQAFFLRRKTPPVSSSLFKGQKIFDRRRVLPRRVRRISDSNHSSSAYDCSCHHHHHPSGLSKDISVPMLDQTCTCTNITHSERKCPSCFSCLLFFWLEKEKLSRYNYSMICFPARIYKNHLELAFSLRNFSQAFVMILVMRPINLLHFFHRDPGRKDSEI